MTDDFNLSKKMKWTFFKAGKEDVKKDFFFKEDVKEFIKRLKEELCNEYLNTNNGSSCDRIPQQSIIEKIDNLAGDDLK